MSSESIFRSGLVRLSAAASGALSVLLVGLALFGDDGVTRHEKLREELRRIQGLNAQLDADNAALRAEATALKEDPEHLEVVIRDELGWARRDAVIFIFPSQQATAELDARAR
jgi:cell division protein FtsB